MGGHTFLSLIVSGIRYSFLWCGMYVYSKAAIYYFMSVRIVYMSIVIVYSNTEQDQKCYIRETIKTANFWEIRQRAVSSKGSSLRKELDRLLAEGQKFSLGSLVPIIMYMDLFFIQGGWEWGQG